MKSRAYVGMGVIAVIALADIAFDASDLRAQRNSNVVSDMIPAQAPQQAAPGGNSPAVKGSSNAPVGKSTISRQQTVFPVRTTRTPSMSFDPTRNAPLSPKTSPYRAAHPASGVTTAHRETEAAVPSNVTPAGFTDPNRVISRDGMDVQPRPPGTEMPPAVVTPAQRMSAPNVRGKILGINGETAVEISIRLKQEIQELRRENDELRQLNSGLQSRVDESQNHLLNVVREVQTARKDMAAARSDVDRLRHELESLQDKIRISQKEHSDLLKSMGPLLQQMLEADEVSSLNPNPME